MFASLLKLGELIRIFSSVRKYFLLRVDSIWRVQSSMEAIFNTSKQDQSAKVVPFVKMAEKHGIHLKITPGQVITVTFGYKTVFSFQNDPKNLDPSYKMDLDLWNLLGVKLVLKQNNSQQI